MIFMKHQCYTRWFLTFKHHFHQYVSQERIVHKIPEPGEVDEEEVNGVRVRFQQQMNSGPELSCRQRSFCNSSN